MIETCESASELRTYLVPRHGTTVSIRAGDPHALRLARTELELLKRLRRRVAQIGSTSNLPTKHRYSQSDRRELVEILIDAQNPIVDEMIALIDRDYGDLRKEILMTVVNEQAENLAQEAAESGAIEQAKREPPAETTAPPDQNQPHDPPVIEGGEADVEAALAAAEAELAKVVGADSSTDASAEAQAPDVLVEETPQPSTDGAPPEDDSADADESAGSPSTPASAESAGSEDAPETPDAEPREPADETPEADSVDDDATASSEPEIDTPADEDQHAEAAADVGDFTDDYSPQRAERAVVEIEKGIRKLASILSNEVNDQWKRAQEAFDDTIESRKKTQRAHRDATDLLRDISHLREEAQIARDDANVARREAKLIREDAKVAKERADASAAAAEASADEAEREAENALRRRRSKR